ncbi:MAG: hypothetical protein AAB019_07285 [Planctomycetota bacterium]
MTTVSNGAQNEPEGAAMSELLRLAGSASLRADLEWIASHRHNPFVKNNRIDVDTYIEFLTQYNEFINHRPKPFVKMIDREMKL